MFGRRRIQKRVHEIAPEDIFLDSSNLASMDASQFEGRVEKPVARGSILAVGAVFLIVAFGFSVRAFDLQIMDGEEFAKISENNRLERSVVFASRGIIYDRTGQELAWNKVASSTEIATTTSMFAERAYLELPGLAHLMGYVSYPKADKSGNWWREDLTGVSGVELVFDGALRGENGDVLIEKDALGDVQREDIVTPASPGEEVRLSINAEIQSKLHEYLSAQARAQRFDGGAAVIMDIHTGEVIAMTSFPEYDHAAFAAGDSAAVASANANPRSPLLNRAIAGLYTPGSIVKPIFAAGALAENIIAPETAILSTGALTVPNPYFPDQPSIFKDWKAHGWTNMREAIAVSSDVYFYTIGGGTPGQAGLGISRLDKYAKAFGLSEKTGIALTGEESGLIPTPEWKLRIFDGDEWRLGDTYNTSIGQYGFQLTPLQAARFAAAIANGGDLVTPQLIQGAQGEKKSVGISNGDLQIIREGMRMAVVSSLPNATVKSLNISGVKIGAKSGTAEVGTRKQYINSLVVGFWPYDNPRYAFSAVLERAPSGTLSGAAPGIRPFFEWLAIYKPEYANGTAK